MRRIPAYGVAVVMIGYAVGKAVFAVEGRLGFPSGPIIPPDAAEAYFLNPTLAQAFAAISGLAGAALALATVSPFGRRVPRKLLLAGVLLLAIGVGAGAVVMVLDGFVGLGIGWQWYHGVVGLVMLGLLAALAHGSLRADAGRDHAGEPMS